MGERGVKTDHRGEADDLYVRNAAPAPGDVWEWYAPVVAVVVLFLLIGGGVVLWAVSAVNDSERKRDTALGQIAAYLGGQAQGASAFGKINGVTLLVRFESRGSGSNTSPWTEIDVEVPRWYPLAVHVRHHAWLDKGRIARGDMIDVQLGDPAFDEAFLVEAAPEDVARALLDGNARGFLSAHDHAEFDTVMEGEQRFLRFAVPGWIEDLAALSPMIDQVARIGVRVREAYADVERAAPIQVSRSPYRSELTEHPTRDASAARAAEVAALEAIRAKRAERQKVMAVTLMVVIFLIFLIGLAMGTR